MCVESVDLTFNPLTMRGSISVQINHVPFSFDVAYVIAPAVKNLNCVPVKGLTALAEHTSNLKVLAEPGVRAIGVAGVLNCTC